MKHGVSSLGLLIKVEWCSVPSNKGSRDLVLAENNLEAVLSDHGKYKGVGMDVSTNSCPSILLDRHLCDDAPCTMPAKSFAVLIAERLFCRLFQRFYVVFFRNGVM